MLEQAQLLLGVGPGVGQVVHDEEGGEHGDDGQAGVHPRGPLEVDAARRGLDQPEDAGTADDHGQEELDDRDTEVAAGRVEAEGRAHERAG
ncbi:hypothetical protein [Nocardioides kongjuensis]|uniref:hypothetical protein n=1 Tax=Nocardioides kongjuensis TaxID=349522 RepID=UPI0031E9624B